VPIPPQSQSTGPLSSPALDPTSLFEMVRWSYGTELLGAAVAHFGLFDLLARRPLTLGEVGETLGLAPRPAHVLLVALCAMGLLEWHDGGHIGLTQIGREHLVRGGEFYAGDYVGLIGDTPGVKHLVERLRANKPAQAHSEDPGAAYIFREGIESAMDSEASARRLTLALSGRARIVGPALAKNFPLPAARRLLDVGGGSGLYAVAMLRANPSLRAAIWDRAEVLKVARESAERYGVSDRTEFVAGDMFADPVPPGCDVMLLSNVLHDWDVPECQRLLDRCAGALPPGGRLLIHDVFLNDALDGPLPVALYSAALFNVTEGRAYSGAEYRAMLVAAGLEPGEITPTLVHCGVLPGTRRESTHRAPK
jgi:ubiquinone/menaquinone biosynthesis C-methylase UbiE